MNKFAFRVLRRKIWIKQQTPTAEWCNFFELTEEQAQAIDDWVQQLGLGRRVAYDRWTLDSKESLMLFKLKWM